MKYTLNQKISFFHTALILSSSYILLALFFWLLLDFDFLRSDPLWYWKDSLNWQAPYNPFHVPGYPLLIALLRGITNNVLPPALIMMSITFIGLLISAAAVYHIILHYQDNDQHAFIGSCLFGLWPLVGMTYLVFPHADIVAMAVFLFGFLSLIKNRLSTAALFLGLSLICHKVLWPYVVFIIIADCYQHDFRLLRQWRTPLLVSLPLVIIWFLGSLHYQSTSWMFASSINIGTTESTPTLPIMPGLHEVLISGGLKALVKGGFIISLALLSIGICYYSLHRHYQHFAYSIAFSLSSLLFFLTMSSEVLWASVRFSRLLIIPIFWIIASHNFTAPRHKTALLASLLLGLLISQFVYGWYMEKIFFGSNLHPFNH